MTAGPMPRRIQRKRSAGWRKPEGSVIVDRSTKWGNPIRWTDYPKYVTPGAIDGDNEPVRVSDAERRRWAATDFDATVRLGIGAFEYPSIDEIQDAADQLVRAGLLPEFEEWFR